jgi:serine/threonine protein kinase
MLVFGFDIRATATKSPTLNDTEVAGAMRSPSVRFLGAGTFGETWLFHDGSEPRVAKFLLDPNAAAHSRRIQREVESLNRAASPHVVRLISASQVPLSSGPRLTLIFEYIDGGDIQGRVEQSQRPSSPDLLAFAVGALAGIAELHSKEVVHRDIKPGNIALRGGSWAEPVLLDLGLGRILDASAITPYPCSIGTPPYMAPEVVQGSPARKGSDLWSLGVMLFLLGTGTHPFYPNPAERLAPDDAYDRLCAGLTAPAASIDEPLRSMVVRFLEVEPYRRGSARRALTDLQGV